MNARVTLLFVLSLMLNIVWLGVVVSNGLISMAITMPLVDELPPFKESMLMLLQLRVL